MKGQPARSIEELVESLDLREVVFILVRGFEPVSAVREYRHTFSDGSKNPISSIISEFDDFSWGPLGDLFHRWNAILQTKGPHEGPQEIYSIMPSRMACIDDTAT